MPVSEPFGLCPDGDEDKGLSPDMRRKIIEPRGSVHRIEPRIERR
jgi:hypothetical protein